MRIISFLIVFLSSMHVFSQDFGSTYKSNKAERLVNAEQTYADDWYLDFSQPSSFQVVEFESGTMRVFSNTLPPNTLVTLEGPDGVPIQGNDCDTVPLCKLYYLSGDLFPGGAQTFTVRIPALSSSELVTSSGTPAHHNILAHYFEDLPSPVLGYLGDARNTAFRMQIETIRSRLASDVQDVASGVKEAEDAIMITSAIGSAFTSGPVDGGDLVEVIAEEAILIALGEVDATVTAAAFEIGAGIESLVKGNPWPAYQTIALSLIESGVLIGGLWDLAGVENALTAAYMSEITVRNFLNDGSLLQERTDQQVIDYAEANVLPDLLAQADCNFLGSLFGGAFGCRFESDYDQEEFLRNYKSMRTILLLTAEGFAGGNFYDDVDGDGYANASDSHPNDPDLPGPPVINLEPEVTINGPSGGSQIGQQINVTGSFTDPNGDAATAISWTLIAPDGSSSSFANTGSLAGNFTPDIEGTYTVQLSVSDGELVGDDEKDFTVTAPYPNLVIDYTDNDDGEVKIYIEDINFSSTDCQLQDLPSVTVPAGERWTRITFAASGEDIILLMDDDEQPTLRNSGGRGCTTGFAQNFNAEEEFDWDGGTNIYESNKDNIEAGTTLYFGAFSYEGSISNYSINTTVRVTTDLDGDGVPDGEEDAACLNNSNDAFDSDSDLVCDSADAFPNDPAASQDTDGDGYPNSWNPGRNQGDSTTSLALDQFPTNAGEWIDSDLDGVGDNQDAFDNDIAASEDTDGDGAPDEWNNGFTSGDSTTGLVEDQFDNDIAASLDTDLDGCPDAWNVGYSSLDSTTNLDLDAFINNPNECLDTDGDGVGDVADWAPLDFSEWVDADLDGVGDNTDVDPADPLRSTNEAPVITEIDAVQLLPGGFTQQSVNVFDADGDSVQLSLSIAPAFVLLNAAVIDISPALEDDGYYQVLLVAEDPFGGIDTELFTIATDGGDADPDADNVINRFDNCTEVANEAQADSDNDGYGNLCDGDLNGDGAINFADLGIMRSRFFTGDPDADLNGDGAVNFTDLGLLKQMFFQMPGPSGIAP